MNKGRKFAIVTGASSGIGSKIALTLAGAGIHVGLISRNRKRLAESLEKIRGSGGNGEKFVVDLRREKECLKFLGKIKIKWKCVDYLINVARIYHNRRKAFYGIDFTDYKTSEIRSIFEVGINGPVLLSWGLFTDDEIRSTYNQHLRNF